METKIKDLKKGDFFKRKPEGKVYVRGEYMRGSGRFAAVAFHDICHIMYFKPDTIVYVGFDF